MKKISRTFNNQRFAFYLGAAGAEIYERNPSEQSSEVRLLQLAEVCVNISLNQLVKCRSASLEDLFDTFFEAHLCK